MSKIIIKKSPEALEGIPDGYLKVFLAGSIEMGKAEDWQERITKELNKYDEIAVLNPRRDDWDSSWEQTIENKDFKEQVEWELSSMEAADLIVMYFDKDTKSPITLLELGLNVKGKQMVVCCPDGFYRKGNVEVVCDYYGFELIHSFDELIDRL